MHTVYNLYTRQVYCAAFLALFSAPHSPVIFPLTRVDFFLVVVRVLHLLAVIVFRVLFDLLEDPRHVLWHVCIDSGKPRMGAFYAPADYPTDEPSILICLVLAEKWTAGIAL